MTTTDLLRSRAAQEEATPITNTLYYGDNLDILHQYISDDSVDLVYLDPPFNSNATYNVLFAEQDGSRTAGPIRRERKPHPRREKGEKIGEICRIRYH